jgi:hypothetical protein
MDIFTDSFNKPANWKNPEGKDRKVGFELEFSGIDIENCISILHKLFKGTVEFTHSNHASIEDSSIGSIKVELDFKLLQAFSDTLENNWAEKVSDYPSLQSAMKEVSRLSGVAVKGVVPLEISTSPLSFEQFPEMEKMRRSLRREKAEGTKENITNAFGLHINPEVPSFEISVLLNYIRAFIILYPWLKKTLKTDLSRRLLSYIDAFPWRYQKIVVRGDYQPDQDQFIEDFLKHNSTRNRPLDMLPLLAEMDASVIDRLKKKEKKLLSPRPAFHYRLPNCNIDSEEWRVAHEWNGWCLVENLAADRKLLEKLCASYKSYLEKPLEVIRETWPVKLEAEIGDQL